MKLKYYCREILIASTMAAIALNDHKPLIFTVVTQFRTNMRVKVKQEKKT